MVVREEVVKYISGLTNEVEIDPTVSLFESGLLTSLDVLDLLAFVENEFDLTISDDDFGVENFGSINKMVGYIERSKQECGAVYANDS